MRKIIVISLGGSLIVPEKISIDFLKEFRKVILKNIKKYKFIIVCGGGKIARNYINALDNSIRKNKKYFECLIGISVTRLNARFMTYFFETDEKYGMPHEIKDIEERIRERNFVFCGGMRYEKDETSDSTSAKLARHFKTEFINITNVQGLYDKDPKKFKDAKFIPEINHKDFYKIAKKIKFKPGQHFVLDKKAARIIKKYNIKTYIIGPDVKNLDNLLNNKHFIGTIISK
ncbi:MAG: UMP kinase [Candidatus Pacearchaeota archaeon]